jgi:hypothetical protein
MIRTETVMIEADEYAAWETALLDLERTHGELTPQLVLWAASAEASPLHAMFTWDDTVAANAYREQQARGLIRRVQVKMINLVEETETKIRVFHNVTRTDEEGIARRRYINVETVLKDDALRAQMLDNAKRELAAFRSKYAVLSELSRVFAVIDEVTE